MILKSATGISIGGKIDGQCKVRMFSKSGQIVVHGKIDGGSSTEVHYDGVEKFNVLEGIQTLPLIGTPSVQYKDWETADAEAAEAEEERKQLAEYNKNLESAFQKLKFEP